MHIRFRITRHADFSILNISYSRIDAIIQAIVLIDSIVENVSPYFPLLNVLIIAEIRFVKSADRNLFRGFSPSCILPSKLLDRYYALRMQTFGAQFVHY